MNENSTVLDMCTQPPRAGFPKTQTTTAWKRSVHDDGTRQINNMGVTGMHSIVAQSIPSHICKLNELHDHNRMFQTFSIRLHFHISILASINYATHEHHICPMPTVWTTHKELQPCNNHQCSLINSSIEPDQHTVITPATIQQHPVCRSHSRTTQEGVT